MNMEKIDFHLKKMLDISSSSNPLASMTTYVLKPPRRTSVLELSREHRQTHAV